MRRSRMTLPGLVVVVLAACGRSDGRSPADPDPDLQPPTAVLDLITESLLEGDPIRFRVRSSDNRGLASRSFVFGDGETAMVALGGTADDDTLSHVYAGGQYTASVTYADASGLAASASVSLEVAAPQWSSVVQMPYGVRSPGVASVRDNLYVFGGSDPLGARTAHTQVYDAGSGTWTLGADMPDQSDYLVAAVSEMGVHVLGGGRTGAGDTDAHRLYDPSTNTWSLLPAMPIALHGAAALVVADKLYVFAGSPGGRAWLDNTQIYDVKAGTWSVGAPIPGPRISPVAVESGGVVHVLGGGTPDLLTSSEHWIYDPVANTWSAGPGLPAAREAMGAGVLDGWICIFGGREAKAGRFNTPFADTYCLEPGGPTWKLQEDMPTPRAEVASAVLNGWIYGVGGHDDQDVPRAVVERFKR